MIPVTRITQVVAAILALATCLLRAQAEVVIYNYSGKHHLIQNGAEFRVPHTGRLILDYNTGQGYRVDTYKYGPARYVRVTTIDEAAYYRVIGPRNSYSGVVNGAEVGIGKESIVDLGGGLLVPLARTLTATINVVGGDDVMNASYSSYITSYKFDSRATINANIAFYDALFVTYGLHQHYLELGYVDRTP